MTATRKTFILLLTLAAAIPAASTALFIHHFGVDARYCDDWWFFTDLLVKGAHDTLTLRDLFAQYNESRTFFPRLVILALNKVFHGDIRSQYYFSWLLACATAINLYILSAMTGQPLVRRLWLLCLASILIFTAVQYQTWLWGVQIVVFFPIFSLTLALLIVESHLPALAEADRRRSGLPLRDFLPREWNAPLATDRLRNFRRHSLRRDLIAPLIFWIALALASLFFYFQGYTKPYWTPGFLPALQHPLTTIHFFFALLGMPLAWGYSNHTIAISTLLGLFQVALLLFLIARIIRNKNWRGAALPWLIFAVHVALTAGLTAAGRAGFGVQYAATLRYTSYSLFISVAIVYLIPFAFDAPRHLVWKLLAVGAVFLVLLTIQPACAEASRIRAKYLAGRAALHYILVLNTKPQPGDLLSPGDTALPTAAAALNDIGYLHPPLAKSTTIEPAQTRALGHLDQAAFDTNSLTVTGVALLPDRAADAVVIAAGHGSGIARASAIAVIPLDDPFAQGHFTATLPANFPTGAKDILAFAIDGYSGQAYLLANAFPIPKPPESR